MRPLNSNDALFLVSESAHANANVSLIQIYDPSTAPGGRLRFKSILALVESRLHLSPIFRQKLREVPFGLDDPYWIEDEHFDLEYHVRNIALGFRQIPIVNGENRLVGKVYQANLIAALYDEQLATVGAPLVGALSGRP